MIWCLKRLFGKREDLLREKGKAKVEGQHFHQILLDMHTARTQARTKRNDIPFGLTPKPPIESAVFLCSLHMH